MAVLLFAVFAVTLLLGIPVAFSIMLSAVAVLVAGDVSLGMVAQRMFASVNSFPLVAVPFFILAGDLLANGAISRYLVAFAESFLGMIKGGLSIISVVVAMFFAAISGSGAATTAAVGATLIPQLKERGYKEDQSAALIAAAGTIGVVIPPSVPMVLYAVAAGNGVTVNRLFANGFVPGLMMGGILIAISLYQAYMHSYPKGGSFEFKRFVVSFLQAVPGIIMPAIILGGIFFGKFTTTEAAAVAVVYALFASFVIYRDMTFPKLFDIMKGSAKTSTVIMIIIACSGPFGWVLASYSIPDAIANAVLSVSTNKYILMTLVAVIIIIAGVFMETSSAIIILT
ncbi:MAG: TRAP transporter large permease, partial [Peptococcaceae bacterium]|nr:TRAP transporter large permease [Peptococcaceae bacterium]